jgi:hypothetical protein
MIDLWQLWIMNNIFDFINKIEMSGNNGRANHLIGGLQQRGLIKNKFTNKNNEKFNNY